jgi:hypothetical protein
MELNSMAANNSNPLAKHFRQPSIYIKLPSNGKFYPEDSVEVGVTGEIPVYPMTVQDEITIRTPDALMNGESIVKLIKSCCPSIKNPYDIPIIDLDTILIAIRIASYDQEIDIDSKCTHCDNENSHSVDLRKVLDSIDSIAGYQEPHNVDGLTIELQPQKFNDINLAGMIAFEQQKLIANIQGADITPEDKKTFFNESFKKLTDLNVATLAHNISSITTEDGITVTDQAMITEFLLETNRNIYEQIKTLINSTIDKNKLKPMTVECDGCSKTYPLNIDFNQSNFFV